MKFSLELAKIFSTGLGIGYLPQKFTPFKKNTGAGFLGTLLALLLVPILPKTDIYFSIFMIAFFSFSVWAISITARFFNTRDDPKIILDEILGYWTAIAFLPRDIKTLILLFIFFRALDTLKPWPITRIENKTKGSFAIIIDDIVAGAEANILMRILLAIL